MIFANYIITCADAKKASEVSEILNMVISRIKHTPGCIQTELWINKDCYKFMVAEIWKTRTDFERHINSTLFKHLLEAMEISSEKPDIRISECENIQGIELIEEVMKPF